MKYIILSLLTQMEGVTKVLEIFSSETVEASVRKSAADQLAIMLQGTLRVQKQASSDICSAHLTYFHRCRTIKCNGDPYFCIWPIYLCLSVDPGLHDTFVRSGGLDQIHVLMKAGLTKPEADDHLPVSIYCQYHFEQVLWMRFYK